MASTEGEGNSLFLYYLEAFEHFLNEVLPKKQFPQLTFRIGIYSGEAVVKGIGDYSNKQHKDLIGLTVDLASNIQGLAKENGILIGDILNWDFMQIDEHVLQGCRNILRPKMKSLFSSYVDQIP